MTLIGASDDEGLSLGSEVLRSFAVPPDLFIPSEIMSAWPTTEVPYANKRRRLSPAQKAGLAYQKRIVKYCQSPSWSVRAGEWYCYSDLGAKRRYCQPDILLDSGILEPLVVVEVKLRWTALAWWQLRKLYVPVLQRVYPNVPAFVSLAICRSYDPAIQIPEKVNLCDDIFDAKPSAFNVLVVR